jgi:hypothetical protein
LVRTRHPERLEPWKDWDGYTFQTRRDQLTNQRTMRLRKPWIGALKHAYVIAMLAEAGHKNEPTIWERLGLVK